MEVRLSESQEDDLRDVYQNHALYHLARQHPGAGDPRVTGFTLKPEPGTEFFAINEATCADLGGSEDQDKGIRSFVHKEDAGAVRDRSLKTDVKRGFGYFGSESSSFALLNAGDLPSAAGFDESDAATGVDDLNQDGLSEEQLDILVNGVAHLTDSHNDEIHSHNHEIQSRKHEIHSHNREFQSHKHEIQSHNHEILAQSHEILETSSDIHPVELTKSTSDCDKPAKVPDIAKIKIVDLMDASSISELKRLWVKKGGSEKGQRKGSAKSSDKEKTSKKKESSVKPLRIKLSKEREKQTPVKPKTITGIKKKKIDGVENKKKDLKTCLIKMKKVENMNFTDSDLKVDLTVPKSRKQYKSKPVSTLSKKTVKTVTKYVAKSVGLESKKAKKEVTKFTMKAIKKVTKKIAKKRGRPPKTAAEKPTEETTMSIKVEPLSDTEYDDNVQINGNVMDHDECVDFEDCAIDDLDYICGSSDDNYITEDEFNPAKTKTLKDAFTKTKKRRKKNPLNDFISKKSKLDTMPIENEHNPDKPDTPKRKYVRKANSVEAGSNDNKPVSDKPKRKYVKSDNFSTGKRIGRPPVLGHFECKHCSFTADEKNLVDKHAKVHMRPLMQCQYCDATFRAENTLWEHEARKHTNEKPFKCQVEGCDYSSKCKNDLDRHQSKHATEKMHVCKLCGWTTKWRRNLRSHHLMKHTSERKFRCPDCPFTCKRKTDLKQHMYRHSDEKPIICLLCGFQTKTNWELQSHMLSHSDERPFKCTHPGCTQGTKTRADLNKHMRKHATERNFLCEICSKGFKCRQSLNKHYPMHRDVRNFACDVCGNRFKSKAAMRKHLQLHSGIKPYRCEVCDMRFAVANNLKSHMVTHDTSNRPFLCPLCPHASKQQDHLLAHIGTFHGKSYTYFCEFCKKPFGRFGQLRLHYKRMHKDRDVSSLGQVDLSALKMELKQELEDASEILKKESKKKPKKGKKREVEVIIVKEEPQDSSYGDVHVMKEAYNKNPEENVETKTEKEGDNVNVKDVKENESKHSSDSKTVTDNEDIKDDQKSEKESVMPQEGLTLQSVTETSDQMEEKSGLEISSENKSDEKTDEVKDAPSMLSVSNINDQELEEGDELSSEKKDDELSSEKKDDELSSEQNDDELCSEKKNDELSREKKDDELSSEKKNDELSSEQNDDELCSEKKNDELSREKKDDELSSEKKDDELSREKKDDEMSREKNDDEMSSEKNEDELSSEKKKDEIIDEMKDKPVVITVNEMNGQVSEKESVEPNSEKRFDEDTEEVTDEPIVLDGSEDEEDEKDIKDQSHIYYSSQTARLAVYEGFRLPLATKGFEFNYDKTGKKPRAWFMDVDLMNEKDSKKQQKYLRRIGVLPPLPRGHPGMSKKYSLTAFVNRRRRKLTERIRKSNQLKELAELGTAMNVNALRKARFQGNYNQFEAQAEDELEEVTEKLGQDNDSVASHTVTSEENGDEEESPDQSKKNATTGGSKMKKKASVLNTKSPKKESKSPKKVSKSPKKVEIEKKKLGRKPLKETKVKTKKLKLKDSEVPASKKLIKRKKLKTTEDKNSGGSRAGKKTDKGKTVIKISYKQTGKGKSAKNVVSNGKKSLKGKTDTFKAASNDVSKTKKVVTKQAGGKRKFIDSAEKPKYSRMYVPVKKRKTAKESKPSKESETQNKPGKKSTKGKPAHAATNKRKSKVAGDPSLRNQVNIEPALSDSQNYLNSSFITAAQEALLSVKQEPETFTSDIYEHSELPDAVTITQSEAAYMNECGMMHNQIVILKTDVAVEENDDNELDEYSLNSEALVTSNAADSGIGEETLGDIGFDKHDSAVSMKTDPAVSMKTEDPEPDEHEVETQSYMIIDAETGKIKEALNVQMDETPEELNESDGSGIQVKQEPDDRFC